MKLQQLKYLIATVDNGLNITAASEALFTSQPGVSKQIKLLEEELSLQLFVRKGKSLASLTDAGERVVERARRMLAEADQIKQLSSELAGQKKGELTIATTATQARYVLPDMLGSFQGRYPDIALRMHQGTSTQIADEVLGHEADFAIASGESSLFEDLITVPIYSWERTIIVPRDHELALMKEPGLADFARFPIISYTNSFSEESSLAQAFEEAGVQPNVVFTAQDPDTIKTYVRKGMGIGIIACMAFDRERDDDLVAISATGLFSTQTTWVGFRKDRFLRDYMYDFLLQVVPGTSRESIDALIADTSANSNVIHLPPLRPVENHPTFGGQFNECCGGL